MLMSFYAGDMESPSPEDKRFCKRVVYWAGGCAAAVGLLLYWVGGPDNMWTPGAPGDEIPVELAEIEVIEESEPGLEDTEGEAPQWRFVDILRGSLAAVWCMLIGAVLVAIRFL